MGSPATVGRRRVALLEADTGPRLFALGAYVGEVLARELGGVWRVDADTPASEEGLTDGPPRRVDGVAAPARDEAVRRRTREQHRGVRACGRDPQPGCDGKPRFRKPLTPEQVTARHPRNKYIALEEIAGAALHRGRLNDRLNITMRSGVGKSCSG